MARETWVQSQVESYQRLKKWYLMLPCLTLNIIRSGSRVMWSNLGKGVAPSPTPWCSSYRKGSLRVTLDLLTYNELYWKYPGSNIPENSSCTITSHPWKLRWTRHTGHCWSSKKELISDVLQSTFSHRCTSVGQRTKTYLQKLCTDPGCSLEDMLEAMDDRDE